MTDCTCFAPDDAEPEDHDDDCPENPGNDEENADG
jgi:hypothetical protein